MGYRLILPGGQAHDQRSGALCGYYTLISFLLNAFAVQLPPDALPMWAASE